MRTRVRNVLLLLLPLLLVPACSDSSGPGRVVTTVVVTPAEPSVADGATQQMTATLRDQHGQAFNATPAGVSVTWSSGDAAIAEVGATGLLTGARPGQATITASAGQASGSTVATVTPVATGLEPAGGDGQTGRVDEALAEPIAARVVDRHGDPVADVTVAWAVTGGGGTVAAPTSQSGADGIALASWTLGTTPGANTLTASAVEQSVEFGASAGPAEPAVLAKIGGDDQTGDEGEPLAEPLRVRVTDEHGNPVAGIAVTWTVTAGGGSVAPASAPTDMAGEAHATWALGTPGANTVQASAGEVEGSPATFTAQASSTNQPPIAVDDTATTPYGTSVVIDVLANDSDPDGDPLTVESLTTPVNGAASINADQTVTYTPDTGFHGVEDFEYTINDGHGHTASATVTVSVQPPVQACSPVPGYNKTWQGGVSTEWSHAGNWSPAGVPTAADDVLVCPAAANQPVLSGASVANDLLLRGRLRFAGHTLHLGGDFLANQGAGLTMDGTADRLVVAGDAAFNAGSPPNVLSAGEIRVGGDFSVLFGSGFRSTGTRVVLDGSSPQAVAPNNTGAEWTFADLEISNPAGVEFVSSGTASGSVTLTAASGNVTSSSNRRMIIGGDLVDAIGNRWRVENTVFRGSPKLPAEMMTNISFGSTQGDGVRVTLAAGFATTGDVTVRQPGSRLDLNGHHVRVGGDFLTTQAGTVRMMQSSDLLVVHGNAHFASSGQATDTLNAGEIRVAGDFLATFSASFASSGTRVVLNGTNPQSVSTGGTNPLADLEIANPAGVEFLTDARVNGSVTLGTAAGNVTSPANRTVTIAGDLNDAAGNRWRVATTSFLGSPSLPAQMMTNVVFGGTSGTGVTVTLARGFQTSGDLTVRRAGTKLVLNGYQVRVGGDFMTTASGALTMTAAADLLVIEGNASLNRTPVDTLDAGEMRIAGDLGVGVGGGIVFPSTGTRFVLDGNAPQSVSLISGTAGSIIGFDSLQITNPTGVQFLRNTRLSGDLDLVGQMTVPADITLTIDATLFLRAASVLNNEGTINVDTCEKQAGHTINGVDPC